LIIPFFSFLVDGCHHGPYNQLCKVGKIILKWTHMTLTDAAILMVFHYLVGQLVDDKMTNCAMTPTALPLGSCSHSTH
jgi:hypothetical protein